jgi:hypothetical protein
MNAIFYIFRQPEASISRDLSIGFSPLLRVDRRGIIHPPGMVNSNPEGGTPILAQRRGAEASKPAIEASPQQTRFEASIKAFDYCRNCKIQGVGSAHLHARGPQQPISQFLAK